MMPLSIPGIERFTTGIPAAINRESGVVVALLSNTTRIFTPRLYAARRESEMRSETIAVVPEKSSYE